MTGSGYLRYAPHLGYLSLDQPLFRASVGDADPANQARFAADSAFAGVFDPWMLSRPADEIDRLLAVLRDRDLECGAIAFAPFPVMFSPLFAAQGKTAWEEIKAHLERAMDLAGKAGATSLAIVLQGSQATDMSAQHKAAAEHLNKAGDLAAARNLSIGIEPMIALPDLMLGSTEQAVALMKMIAHPAVGIIFDTGHVQDMDGDIHAAWHLAREYVCAIQLADMPGRIEPGAGELDLTRFLIEAARDGKADGLIELEHGWSAASAPIERSGISKLLQIDADVRVGVEGGRSIR